MSSSICPSLVWHWNLQIPLVLSMLWVSEVFTSLFLLVFTSLGNRDSCNSDKFKTGNEKTLSPALSWHVGMTETACAKIKHFNKCSTLKPSINQPFTSVPVVRTAVMLGKRLKIACYCLVTKMSACLKNKSWDTHWSGGKERKW